MKVAFVHFHTFRLLRGIETLILSLANELAAKGVDVSVLAARRTLDKPLVDVDPRVMVKEFPTFRYYEYKTIAPLYFLDFLKSDYDIVNVFFADFGESAAIRAALHFTHFRVNLYICYPIEAAPHRFESFRRTGLSDRADVVICDSDYVAAGAERYFGRKCTVIPVGTDSTRFRRDEQRRRTTRERLGISDDQVVLLTVSHLEKRKGIDRVLEATALARRQAPNILCIIVGSGPEMAALQTKARALGLEGCVTFIGDTTETLDFYNASDIYVMLPDFEANSIASHEAMACELPVVASASGGFLEVLDPTCGRLVPVDDLEKAALALVELSGSAQLRRELGAQARRRVEKTLNWSVIADSLIRTFRDQLEGKARLDDAERDGEERLKSSRIDGTSFPEK